MEVPPLVITHAGRPAPPCLTGDHFFLYEELRTLMTTGGGLAGVASLARLTSLGRGGGSLLRLRPWTCPSLTRLEDDARMRMAIDHGYYRLRMGRRRLCHACCRPPRLEGGMFLGFIFAALGIVGVCF